MAFTPNIDYVGHQRIRQEGLQGVTKAKLATKLRREEEERRAAAEAASKKKKSSFGKKLVGAVARGAAAYYTAGASEATGLGSMLDQQIQGGEGYERNEYGDLVGEVSTTSSIMTGKKVADATARLNAQSRKDDAMQARMDKIGPRAGLAFAEKREAKDAKNRKAFDEYKGGFLNFGQDVDGLDISATTMDYSGLTKDKKITAKPVPGITYIGEQGDDFESQSGGFIKALKPTTTSGGLSSGLTTEQHKALTDDIHYKGEPQQSIKYDLNTNTQPGNQQSTNNQLPVEEDTDKVGVLGGNDGK